MEVSVVVPVQNEEHIINQVLEELRKIQPKEIILVLNGSNDKTGEIAKNHGCKIIYYEEALGNDIGRAIGAKHCTGDCILFVDGDIKVQYKELQHFINAIREGFDVALNDLSFLANSKTRPHFTTVSKIAVNEYMHQSALSLNSLLAVPHALSKNAINIIGWKNLADPILAQAIAVAKGLRVCAPTTVDVITTNRIRPIHIQLDEKSGFPKTTSRIIGDHLRAIRYIVDTYGPRGGFKSSTKNRQQLYKLISTKSKKDIKYSAVIMLSEHGNKLEATLKEAENAGVEELIVIGNKNDINNKKGDITNFNSIQIIECENNSFFSIALTAANRHANANICVFLEENNSITSKEIKSLLQSIESGAGISLLERKQLLETDKAFDSVSIGQYFINMCISKPELLNNGLSSLPFAINTLKISEVIEEEHYCNSTLVFLKAMLAGIKVDVINPTNWVPSINKNMQKEEILGDQLEALTFLLNITNERGGFTDGGRRRGFL